MGGCGLDLSGWGYELVDKHCENYNEPYGNTKYGEFLASQKDLCIMELLLTANVSQLVPSYRRVYHFPHILNY